ncbi:MAG: HD domain-containing phosphohydrolase [Sulfuricellaceae bacterium]
MTNLQALTHPRIDDRESLEEFKDDLVDMAQKIEQDIARLKQAPNDRNIVADLFRAFHNIKGNAALCKVELGSIVAHPIETLLGRLRDGELHFTELMGEIILLTVDRLELATESLVAGKSLENLQLVNLHEGLEKLSLVRQTELNETASRVIKSVTGFRPATEKIAVAKKKAATIRPKESQVADLHFFRSLAHQFEIRSPHFKGRTARILSLALETNLAGDQPVDPLQLEAAVYMHDVGMMFLPESIWLHHVGTFSEESKKALAAHPGFGAGILERMTGWQGAAEIVRQHHEMPSGAGYPAGLTQAGICPGGNILSIVDAFEAVMLKHSHRGRSRSKLRAIAEVNACDNQFSQEWIIPFNSVVRRMIES